MKPFSEAVQDLIDEVGAPTIEQYSKLVLKYTKRGIRDWPKFLRELADYIEAQPERVELHPKVIMHFIEEALRENKDEALRKK